MFAEYGVLNYWTYLVGAIFIVLVPGPNTLFVLKNSVSSGMKGGYLAACGVFIGDAVLMFLAWAGVATLIKTTPILFNIVRYLGAFYLLYLGSKILYATLTNPKAILFYVSFFVQFIDVNAPHTGISFFILATTLELVSFCYLSFLIISGAFVTQYIRTKKKLAKVGNSLIGLMFVGFAARLATLQS
ncbi:leucine efflux protein LeuE [Escherichia coli]